jgi:hypothetical protein
MFKEFAQPVLLALLVLHALVGYVELGTDSWIANLMTNIASMKGILVLVYTSSIMFVLRFFAGPIVHKISPLGLLFSCAVLAMIGLFWLGNSTAGIAVFLAATIYGVGKTFFWPTMLGVVSERCPKGGALTLGRSALRVFSGGLLGTPGIVTSRIITPPARLAQSPALYQIYGAADQKRFLFFPRRPGWTAPGWVRCFRPEAELTVPEKRSFGRDIRRRMSLKWTALVPASWRSVTFCSFSTSKPMGATGRFTSRAPGARPKKSRSLSPARDADLQVFRCDGPWSIRGRHGCRALKPVAAWENFALVFPLPSARLRPRAAERPLLRANLV